MPETPMSNTPKRKTEIRRALELLSQVTKRENLEDPAAMIEAQRQFQVLRDELTQTENPALVMLASLGERIASYLYREKPSPSAPLRQMVTEIAEHISKQIAFRDEPLPPMGKTTLKLSKGELKLALRDGQRLGELLIKMTMLSPEQVEDAVKVQRATGQRLGEALLQMRLLTPEMLESVLRIQKTKRGSTKRADAWSAYNPPAA